LSEWGTWEDTSSGMTCCISSTSSICCSLQILGINLHGNWIIWIELNSRLAERWWTDWMYGSLYQPNSLINAEIRRASPSTTNQDEREQAHQNKNRKGSLTLLGEIMRGFHYDEISPLVRTFLMHVTSTLVTISTHVHRARRALSRWHKL
jgi:hypothetical protein